MLKLQCKTIMKIKKDFHWQFHYNDQLQSDMFNTYSSKLSYTANSSKVYIYDKKWLPFVQAFEE